LLFTTEISIYFEVLAFVKTVLVHTDYDVCDFAEDIMMGSTVGSYWWEFGGEEEIAGA